MGVLHLVAWILQAYVVLLIIWVLLTWIPMEPGGEAARLHRQAGLLFEPLLRPLRRMIPPVGGRLDLSPLIAVIILEVVVAVLRR